MSPNNLQALIHAMRTRRPFEGSRYERNAEHDYLQGLNCVGEAPYATLEDALDDWRFEYETDLYMVAQDLAETLPPDRQAFWANTSSEAVDDDGLPLHELANKIRVDAANTACPEHARLLMELADRCEASARRVP